jgi:hypothetical protein
LTFLSSNFLTGLDQINQKFFYNNNMPGFEMAPTVPSPENSSRFGDNMKTGQSRPVSEW